MVGMEACAGSHFWAREIARLGHTVRLMAPQYVKPYVKRQKNDRADAEAICEAVQRPSMRFVAVKIEDQQSTLAIHRVRETLVAQKTQLINALRAHLAEFGIVAPQGAGKAMPPSAVALAGQPCRPLRAALLVKTGRDEEVVPPIEQRGYQKEEHDEQFRPVSSLTKAPLSPLVCEGT